MADVNEPDLPRLTSHSLTIFVTRDTDMNDPFIRSMIDQGAQVAYTDEDPEEGHGTWLE